MNKLISVISDTHNSLIEKVKNALKGSDLIIHAGDIGSETIIKELETISKVTAVRGNTDYGEWARKLPKYESVEILGNHIYILHNLDELDLDPKAADIRVVIYGHTHIPKIEKIDEVIYLNPGCTSGQKNKNMCSIAQIYIKDYDIECKIVKIETAL